MDSQAFNAYSLMVCALKTSTHTCKTLPNGNKLGFLGTSGTLLLQVGLSLWFQLRLPCGQGRVFILLRWLGLPACGPLRPTGLGPVVLCGPWPSHWAMVPTFSNQILIAFVEDVALSFFIISRIWLFSYCHLLNRLLFWLPISLS